MPVVKTDSPGSPGHIRIATQGRPLVDAPAMLGFKLIVLALIAAQNDFTIMLMGDAPFAHLMGNGQILFPVNLLLTVGFRAVRRV